MLFILAVAYALLKTVTYTRAFYKKFGRRDFFVLWVWAILALGSIGVGLANAEKEVLCVVRSRSGELIGIERAKLTANKVLQRIGLNSFKYFHKRIRLFLSFNHSAKGRSIS